MCKYLNKHIRYEKGKKVSVIVFDLITKRNELSGGDLFVISTLRGRNLQSTQHRTHFNVSWINQYTWTADTTQHGTEAI